jgi:hypothetical protein
MAVNTDTAAPIAQRSELTVAEDVQALMRALLTLVRGGRTPPAAVGDKASSSIKTQDLVS